MSANSTKQPIETWLQEATARLTGAGITSARLDAELIAARVLRTDRTWLHAHQDSLLSAAHKQTLKKLLADRVNGQPIAYIVGNKEFYGRSFRVNKDVLVPRPESEAIVELALTIRNPNLRLLDIGTGSGVIGITMALERPDWHCDLADISKPALEVARKNASNLGADNTTLLQQNLMGPLSNHYDVVVANLPYVPLSLKDKADLLAEPPLALFAGPDGLELYTQLFAQIQQLSDKPTHIITESLVSQHQELAAMAQTSGYALRAVHGLAQHFIKSAP